MPRELLRQQLAASWSLADRYYLPVITDEVAFWRPASFVCTVRGDGSVEMPDESGGPVPTATVAWLLWHITWWWTNAFRWSQGRRGLDWAEHPWPGSSALAIDAIRRLHEDWEALLDRADLDAAVSGPWDEGGNFARLAGWLNLELMKNVAEVGQLVRLRSSAI